MALQSFNHLNSFGAGGGYSTATMAVRDAPLVETGAVGMASTQAAPGPGMPGGPFTFYLVIIGLALLLKYLTEEQTDLTNLSHIKVSIYNIVAIWISYRLADPLVKAVVAAVPSPAGLRSFVNSG